MDTNGADRKLVLHVVCINADRGYRWYDEYEADLFTENLPRLYRSLKREYGGHVSKMYQERKDGGDYQCGWVFHKLDHYEDTRESFHRETWVAVAEPTGLVNEAGQIMLRSVDVPRRMRHDRRETRHG